MNKVLHEWSVPPGDELAADPVDFLRSLPGPVYLQIPGRDRSRNRAIVTLLHGNEPSGLMAVHALLRQGIEPAVNIHVFICSVGAALSEPIFYHRMLPGEPDLNRCFKAPFDSSEQSQLARAVLEQLQSIQPEGLIDVHNTSGAGPAFGVATFMNERHESLVSMFSHRMVITDLLLGAVMELSRSLCPTVTIECGGARSEESHRVALVGMTQFISLEDVLHLKPADVAMDYFHNPLRLELKPGNVIGYDFEPPRQQGVNLLPDVEVLNFNYVEPDTAIGFVSGEIAEVLWAESSTGEDRLLHYFVAEDGQLKTRLRMKFFMVTNDPEIARTDCLLYFVPA